MAGGAIASVLEVEEDITATEALRPIVDTAVAVEGMPEPPASQVVRVPRSPMMAHRTVLLLRTHRMVASRTQWQRRVVNLTPQAELMVVDHNVAVANLMGAANTTKASPPGQVAQGGKTDQHWNLIA